MLSLSRPRGRRPALRTTAALVALPALALGLAACGDEATTETAQGFDAVEISGEPGEVPEFDWSARLEASEPEVEVLDEGDGAVVEKDQQVLVDLALSNDFAQDVAFETYGDTNPPLLWTVGNEAAPTTITDLVLDLFADEIVPGETTVGTRLAAVVDVGEEWEPETGLQFQPLNIGNEDGMAAVVEISSVVRPGPQGATKAAPAWSPLLERKGDDIVGLDTTGLPEPDAKSKELGKAILIQGTGKNVEKGDTIVANYIGQTYGGEKPFDSSYTAQTPATFAIGTGAVVKGWDQGLVGVKVGSRVLLRVPPELGYGDSPPQGSPIKAGDTLYFVIDVLATG